MPIRPENKARYPKNWKEISAFIRFQRAKGRCECRGECGTDHAIENDNYGFHIYNDQGNYDERCYATHGELHHVTGSKVVLTVAHLDHTPENNDKKNLRGMCQRCHNKLDAPMRRAGMKKRAREGKAIGELL